MLSSGGGFGGEICLHGISLGGRSHDLSIVIATMFA
jgi:hypothetical protein